MPNSWGGTCRMRAGEARVPPDKHARGRSRSVASLCCEETFDLLLAQKKLVLECGKCGRIGFGPSANDHVDERHPLQDILADDFPESSLQPISLHNRVTMFGNNEAYAAMMEKGSDDPEVQMLSSDSLPIA
jgi:hypothetical protein